MSITATIFDIARGSLDDGNGIRTVIYLKGCNLKCQWCHNPESQIFKRQFSYNTTKCISCNSCIDICPNNKIDLNCDEDCALCYSVCPTKALSVVGEIKSTEEVIEVILKDKSFYEKSGGGVTFSGGECLLHPDFMIDILDKCKKNNIHTIIESSFYIPYATLLKIKPDMFFVDIKHLDSEMHTKYTGSSNVTILENIKKYSKNNRNILIRLPIIPNVNDDVNLINTALFVKECGIVGIQLLKYNYLYEGKYKNIGLTASIFSDNTQNDNLMKAYCKKINDAVDISGFAFFKG